MYVQNTKFYAPFSGTVVIILLTITTAAQNEVALSYHSVRGLYFLAVVVAGLYDITMTI